MIKGARGDGRARADAEPEFTTEFGSLEPPPPPLQRLLASSVGRQAAMDSFAGVFAGTVSPAEFFAPDSAVSGGVSQAS